MKHQNNEIPAHLQERWQEVTAWLGEASIRLNEAQAEYTAAILARIALSRELESLSNIEGCPSGLWSWS